MQFQRSNSSGLVVQKVFREEDCGNYANFYAGYCSTDINGEENLAM